MSTNIQVRAVDPELAEAAKRRAAETHQSVSAYVKQLIERDIREQAAPNRALFAEIAADPDRPLVSRADTAAALEEVRREMNTW